MMRRLGALLVAALAALGFPAVAQVAFSEAERAAILTHGPWPQTTPRDPSNRWSGDARAIGFGRRLFSEPRLSRERNLSCASCHDPGYFFADGLARSVGLARVDRNTIAIQNQRLNRWFGWGGRSDTLWAQSLHPILDPAELGASIELVAERVRGARDLAQGYRRAFGVAAEIEADERLLVNLAKALAAYQETLETPRTAFDDFRDALAAADAGAMARYPEAAKRGLKLFVGRGRCNLCHMGPNFTNGEFHSTGRPHFVDGARADPGRFGGVKLLRESPYNRAGRFSDEAPESAARAPAAFVALAHRNWGEFRTPSLRNVANTAPYVHDGSLKDLEAVMRHYSELDMDRLHADGEALLRPLHLSADEIADLIAFLKTLSGGPAP